MDVGGGSWQSVAGQAAFRCRRCRRVRWPGRGAGSSDGRTPLPGLPVSVRRRRAACRPDRGRTRAGALGLAARSVQGARRGTLGSAGHRSGNAGAGSRWRTPILPDALSLSRLSSDTEAALGHPVLVAETFVDPSRFKGARYRASNWASRARRGVTRSRVTGGWRVGARSGCSPSGGRPARWRGYAGWRSRRRGLWHSLETAPALSATVKLAEGAGVGGVRILAGKHAPQPRM